jgi:hypothetical protein
VQLELLLPAPPDRAPEPLDHVEPGRHHLPEQYRRGAELLIRTLRRARRNCAGPVLHLLQQSREVADRADVRALVTLLLMGALALVAAAADRSARSGAPADPVRQL